MGTGASVLWGKAERAGTVQRGKEKAQEHLMKVHNYLEGRCKEDRPRLFPVVPRVRTRGNGHKWKHRMFPLNVRQRFWLFEGDWLLSATAQRGCDSLSLEILQGTWTLSQRKGSRWPCLGYREDQITSRDPFHPSSLCEPVMFLNFNNEKKNLNPKNGGVSKLKRIISVSCLYY